MSIEIQFVDFPKSDDVRKIVMDRFEKCLDHLHLANEVHLNLVFKHVHFTTTELKIMASGDKIHESIHVTGTDVPHVLEDGIQKLEIILRKMSDKLKSREHSGRERRGHQHTNEAE